MSDGPLIEVLNRGKAMLRDCYWWRRITGSEWDQETAEAHIHFDGLPPPNPGPDHSLAELTNYRPFALMWLDQAGGFRLNAQAAGPSCALPSGQLIIQVEMPVPQGLEKEPSGLAEDTSRKLGRIMRTVDPNEPGLMDLASQAPYLPLTSIQLFGYVRSDLKEAKQIGDVIVAELQCGWGLE